MRKATTIIAALAVALAMPTAAQAYTTGGEGSEAEVLTGVGPTWANPVNATAGHAEQYAESQFVQGQTTRELEVKNLHLSIPAQATITGFLVTFNAKVRFAPFSVFFTGRLRKGGVTFGKRTHMDQPPEYPVVEGMGSSTDTWGTKLTPAEVMQPDFGVSVTAENIGGLNNAISVGQVSLVVTYTLPSFYENHVPLSASAKAPVMAWGALTYQGNGGAWTCQHYLAMRVSATNVELNHYDAYECVAPYCESIGKEGYVAAVEQGPASTAYIEAKPTEPARGEYRLSVGNEAAFGEVGWAHQIHLEVGCTFSSVHSISSGELHPLYENGTAIGSAPSKLNFSGLGAGVLKNGAMEVISGNLRLMGYEGGELVTVK